MSESVVADFVAEAVHDGHLGDEPTSSRVLLSEDRLVLASDGGRTAIDLDDVFDVVVTRIPEDLDGFLDQSVLVAYSPGEQRRTAQIRGEHDRIDRFATFLYKAILRGEGAELRHPVRVGGRVLDPDRIPVTIEPEPEAITFRGDGDLRIALEDVTEVVHERRPVDGTERPVLTVRHLADGEATMTEIYHDSGNRLNVLARHLRSEYYRAQEVLAETPVSEREIQTLVSLYAGVDPAAVEDVVADGTDDADGPGAAAGTGESTEAAGGTGEEAAEEGGEDAPTSLLEGLVEKDLLQDAETGRLTHDGALVAVHKIDDVAE